MMQQNGKEALVQVKNLKKYFPILRGVLRRQVGAVQAVDSISFNIFEGETLGLVGESGCGKSTAGRAILQLLKPTDGQVFFRDQELTNLSRSEMRKVRRDMQIIFQDPFSSLNPRMTVGSIISEPLQIHNIGDSDIRKERMIQLMELVGLNPYYVNRYPHEFSGGQRQRIGIARALATNPSFIVADEPISALDVSIQAQVVNLLDDLKEELNLTYLFIAHDLSMVRYISDRVAVMYLGRIVELSDESTVFKKPFHPYTQALLSAIPIPDPVLEAQRHRTLLEGDVPSPADPPKGCRFHPRCQYASDICLDVDPEYRNVGTAVDEHWVACHHAEDFM